MKNIRHNITNIREELLFLHKNKVIELYKEGYCLPEICKNLFLDITTVLYILKKCKIKKQTLYRIYQEQSLKNNNRRTELYLEKDEFYINKFFPQNVPNSLSISYYWFWKDINKKESEKKRKCEHNIRTIRCSLCNAILKDASDIPLEKIKITEIGGEDIINTEKQKIT